MFSATTLIAYAVTCFVLVIVPGPTVTVIVGQSLAHGTAAGFSVVAGTLIGSVLMILIVAIGLQALVGFVGYAFDWIKLVGAAYLVWMGLSMIRANGALPVDAAPSPRSRLKLGLQGFLVLWSNPKALIFQSAFVPQFVDPQKPAFAQVLVLGAILIAIGALTDSVYALLAGQARHYLTEMRVRMVSRLSGLVLMGGGVWLAVIRRP